jgi:Holliday junction DNA helicase RuvA
VIIGLEGKIVKKEPTSLHLNVHGVIYEVFVSLNCSSGIDTKEVYLHTTHIIREDAQSLYGFIDINEKKLFDTVIKINGVGPKVALAICSTFTPSAFATVVTNNDVAMLKQVPGIGAKGASRILVELSGFVVDSSVEEPSNRSGNMAEAMMALESLGFKKDAINKALNGLAAESTGELVKLALKKLQK